MKISKISISQIKGIEGITFAPKSITVIKGRNGSGKSSVIDAIRAVFSGGSDPGWLRHGADSGSIIIELDNGTTITKSVKRGKKGDIKCGLEILDPQGVPVPAPQTFLGKLSESIDPARILAIDGTTEKGRKELVNLLLNLMPVEFSIPEVQDACTVGPEPERLFIPERALDLDGLKKLREQITEQRRRVGVQKDEAAGTVQQIRKSFTAADDRDWAAQVNLLEEQRESARLELIAAREMAQSRARQQERDIEADIEAKIEALRKEKSARLQQCKAALDAAMKRLEDVARPELDRLTAAFSDAKARMDSQAQAAAAKRMESEFVAKQKDYTRKYDRHTSALENLDKLRKTKLDNLPVPGLEFSGDRVTVDGADWSHVNTARRAEIAIQLTALTSGSLAFLVVDDAEHLDLKTRAALHQAIVDGGYQFVEAVVDPEAGPLRVESHEGVPALF